MDNKQVPFTMTLNSQTIPEIDTNNPEYDWYLYPVEDQMNVNLLIVTLDQNLTEDSPEIPPPRGISSINTLSIIEANFHSTSGRFSNLEIECDIPDFMFFPLELETVNNECNIYYQNESYVMVLVNGEVTLQDGNVFDTTFVKEFEGNLYNTYLAAQDDSVLTFETIKEQIFPTISTDTANILPDNEFELDYLSTWNIYEDDVVINNPQIQISLDPYLMYIVKGKINSGLVGAGDNDISLEANYINLDGYVFSYNSFKIADSLSTAGFEAFFDYSAADGGFQSLELTAMTLITTNRDLNTQILEELESSNIDAVMDYNSLLKEGINAKVSAKLVDDCNDYTFCRILKSNFVYSLFDYDGIVGEQRTELVAPIDNFALPSGVSFADCTLGIILTNIGETTALTTNLEGDMITIVEEDRALVVNTVWEFTEDPADDIILGGTVEDSIYDDVFGIEIIQITDMDVSGTIDSDSGLNDYEIGGLGIYGQDCFYHTDLITDLQDQNSGIITETIDTTMYGEGELDVDVIDEDCKTTYFKMTIDNNDYNKNNIRGILYFDDPEDILRTSIDIKTDDHVPEIINVINFPYGLLLDHQQQDVVDDNPLSFTGAMEFLGVIGDGVFDLHLYDYMSKGNVILPSFKIGGGNAQFITTEDLLYHYGLDEDSFHSNDLDLVGSFDDLKQDNTLKFQLYADSLEDSLLLFESNFLLFNMVTRTQNYLDTELFHFEIHGHPFNGVFEANNIVEVTPVAELESEHNSVVQMVFDHNKEFDKLGDLTNELMQEWVTRIVRVTEEAERLIADLEEQLEEKNYYYIPEEECPAFEQCMDLPTIKCSQYAQTAVCVETTEVCVTMNQECTEEVEVCTTTTSTGECRQSIYKCNKWENYCENGETQEVCLKYENEDNIEECLTVELTCNYSEQLDAECVGTSQELALEIEQIESDIADLEAFLELIDQLRDSAVCVLKRSKENDVYHECSEDDDELTDIQDDVELLDLVELENVQADMQLEEVIASDEIVFLTELYLYGDWTNKYLEQPDGLIVRKDLSIEEEDAEEGYTNGAHSLIYVSHLIDFTSIELSAEYITESIKMIVCKEYDLGEDESEMMQIYITEFDLLDGDDTICPLYDPVDDSNMSDGLPSESDYDDYQNVNEDGTFETISYDYVGSGEDVDLTEEMIADYNTINYYDSANDPNEYTPAEAINDYVEEDSEEPAYIEFDEASEEFLITDEEHGTNDVDLQETSDIVDNAEESTLSHEEYAQEVQEDQQEIDDAEYELYQFEMEQMAEAQEEYEEDMQDNAEDAQQSFEAQEDKEGDMGSDNDQGNSDAFTEVISISE